MKSLKMNRLLVFLLILMPIMVLADGAAPTLVSIDMVVSNANGAVCYESTYKNGKETFAKTDRVIPFGEILSMSEEYNSTYANTYYEKNDDSEYCLVKKSDIKPKKDTFSLDDTQVIKLEPVNALIFASKLNMRKGPSTAYGTITTIPQGTIVKLTHRAGTWWFYAEYQGKKGWISAQNEYLAYNNSHIIFSMKKITIYDKKEKEIGTIPPLTEINNYIEFADFEGGMYYVNYNGIKGYIYDVDYKCSGKITLLKDANLYQNGKIVKTIKNGTVLEYITSYDGSGESDEFYIPKENGIIKLHYDEYKTLGGLTCPKKTSGYLGEGLFGETKDDKISNTGRNYVEIESENNSEPENNNDNSSSSNENQGKGYYSYSSGKKEENNNAELIIICVLGSIVLALTIIIIILLVNRKKSIKDEVKETKKEEKKGDKDDKKESFKKD